MSPKTLSTRVKRSTFPPNTVLLHTLGCAKNLVDSEHMLGKLKAADYVLQAHNSSLPAEVVIINTCGFIGDAKEESIDTILAFVEAKKRGEYGRVFVMGCLSQRYRNDLASEIKEVDGFFGVNEQEALLQALRPGTRLETEASRLLTSPGHYAYLKISEGCDRACSFCAIPAIRGRQQSVPWEELVSETRRLASLGVKELNLIAQDTSAYGMDIYGKRQLAFLLEKLAAEGVMNWIRLHYTYPASFPMEVFEVMNAYPEICRYLDMPLQHASDKILRSMKRGMKKRDMLVLLDQVRARVPGVRLRTTLITGYPGETERDFQELLDFVGQQAFHRLGVFTYSPEEGTAAFSLGDPVPEDIKQQRRDAIMELQMGISARHNQEMVGQRLKVLIDREEEGRWIGRTEFDSPEVDNEVILEGDHAIQPGEFREVMITGSLDYDLLASPLG